MKYFYIVSEDPDLGECVLIVSEKDYKSGYNASLGVPQKISDTLYDMGLPEEMEGIYGITKRVNVALVRKTLDDMGLEEKNIH